MHSYMNTICKCVFVYVLMSVINVNFDIYFIEMLGTFIHSYKIGFYFV